MEFIGLKIVGLIIVGLFIYGAYRRVVSSGVTADTLLADAQAGVAKLEAYVTAKALEVEAKAASIVQAQTTKEAIEADIAKVKAVIEKVKAAF